MWSKEKYPIGFITFCIALIHFWLVKDLPFFWDSIQLTSKQANHFFENGYRSFILPQEIDSGHPPFMGIYMSLWWHLLGRTILVSHLAILPFVWLWLWVGFLWIEKFCTNKVSSILVLFIFLSEPLWLAQATIMGPDIILVATMSWVVYAYWHQRMVGLFLGSLILGLISMRGAMVLCAIGLYHVLYTFAVLKESWAYLLKRGWPMVPGATLFLIFLWMHYQFTGWVAFHSDSPWAESFQRSDFQGILKNASVFVFRCLEFGKFIPWLIVLFCTWRYRHSLTFVQVFLIGLLLTITVLILINTLPYAHLSANRYFWPIQFLALLLSFSFSERLLVSGQGRFTVLGGWALIYLSTHFWNYGGRITQDWESTLIHLPYHAHRSAVNTYLSTQGDTWSSVETAFPAINMEHIISLTNDKSTPLPLEMLNSPYIFYSVIMNDVDEVQLKLIQEKYSLVQEFHSFSGVRTVLFKKHTKE